MDLGDELSWKFVLLILLEQLGGRLLVDTTFSPVAPPPGLIFKKPKKCHFFVKSHGEPENTLFIDLWKIGRYWVWTTCRGQ